MKGVRKLWAPWRLAYLKSKDAKDNACPFCVLPKEKPSDENLVLFKNERIFVVMNRFPYNPGHLMAIPRAHTGDPGKLDRKTWSELSAAIPLCLEILKKAMQPQGFNLGMNIGATGGAGLPDHLHWHIIPRWNGDTNFMPLIAETKALPTHNATVYHQLQPFFDGFAQKLKSR